MKIFALILLLCASSNLPLRAENLIHNGAFTVGASGWYPWGSAGNDTFGTEAFAASHITSTNPGPTYGPNSCWFQTRLPSWPFYVTNTGTYTYTFDAMAESAYTMACGVLPTYLSTVVPSNTVSVTTSYKRFTNSMTVLTQGWHVIKFMQPTVASRTWIAAVQLQRGAAATAFAPAAVIEVGMDSAHVNNTLFLSDSKTVRFNLWNHGPQTNATIHYDFIDGVWNSNIVSGSISTNALRAGTNTTINQALPARWGNIRAVCYVTNIDNTMDETSFSLLPYAAQAGRNTNGLLGIHSHWGAPHRNHVRNIGFAWDRWFSPNTWLRWQVVFPTLTTTNTFLYQGSNYWLSDFAMEVIATNDLIPILVIAGEDNAWYPETNASLAVMIADATNYAGRVAFRYQDYIDWYELWNEPQQERTTVNLADPEIYVNLATNLATAIKKADPVANLIFGGGYSQASQGVDAWSLLPTGFKSQMYGISFHPYPQTSGGNGAANDPNVTEDNNGVTTANYNDIRQSFNGVIPVLATETAVRDVSGYHTRAVAFIYPFRADFQGDANRWNSEAFFNELNGRQITAMDRITYNFARTVGSGQRHFNIQNNRQTDDTVYQGNHPTIYEVNGVLKPWATALVIADHFLKTPGLGRWTNVNSYYTESYGHTNSLGTVASIWNCDRGNRTLTFTNSNFALYDTMGNLIATNSSTALVTRSVRYMVSGTLTMAQLKATIETATVSTNQDTLAPGLTIDSSPIGQTAVGPGVTHWFAATAIDETVIPYGSGDVATSTQTNVQYRFFVEGASWSPWGATNQFYRSLSSDGTYRVVWQAKDLAGNTSTAYGAVFGDMSGEPETPPVEAAPAAPRIAIVRGAATAKSASGGGK